MITIHPTNTCFDDSMEIIEELINSGCNMDRCYLIHAICLQPDTDKPFSHAWVEDKGRVLFKGCVNGSIINISRTRVSHYNHLRPHTITKYTLEQVAEENRKSGTYGPWKQEYLKLCLDFNLVEG